MFSTQIRCLSTSSSTQAQLKKLIKKTTQIKSPKELSKLKKLNNPSKINPNSKQLRPARPSKLIEPEIPQITKQHAAHLLSKKLGVDVDMNTLGPTSNEDIKYFPVANRQIMLTLLGTTSNQLLDSVVVDKSVRSFLKRDQLEKALMMVRLAKDKGIVAMNRIMEYYLDQSKVNKALDVLHYRKKWGVPANDQTYTILFDGCANVRNGGEGLGSAQVEELKKVLLTMKQTDFCYPNIYHMNSGLQCLLNTKDQTVGLKLFNDWVNKNFSEDSDERWFTKIKPNSTTYSIVLKSLPYSKNDEWIFITGEYVMKEIAKLPESKRDSELYESYIFAFLRSTNLEVIKKGFEALNLYFQFDKEVKPPYVKLSSKPNKFNKPLPILKEVEAVKLAAPKFKYLANIALIDTVMKTYIKYENYDRAMKLFDDFVEAYPKKVDLVLAHRYLQSIQGPTVFEDSLKFYERLSTLGLKPTDVTTFLIFDSIYSKSLRNLNDMGKNTIGDKAAEIFNDSENFVKTRLKDKLNVMTMSGYLKSMRRLRLTNDQREIIFSRISEFKDEFEKDVASNEKGLYNKILETEKFLRDTIEKKKYLKKMDYEGKPSVFLKKVETKGLNR